MYEYQNKDLELPARRRPDRRRRCRLFMILWKGNPQSKAPGNRRLFCCCIDNGDGTADVYLLSDVEPLASEDGFTDYDLRVVVVTGVDLYDGLETDIRNNYEEWLARGEEIGI